MANAGNPTTDKVEYLLDEMQKAGEDDTVRKAALGKQLLRLSGGAPLGDLRPDPTDTTSTSANEEVSSPTSNGVQSLKDITTEMVSKADLPQLEAWALLPSDGEWEDEGTKGDIETRLKSLRPTSSPPSQPQPVPPNATVPDAGGTGGTHPNVVARQLSPKEAFEASLKEPALFLKQPLMNMYDQHPDLAAAVKDAYDTHKNPALSEELLLRLAGAGLLWRDRNVYRVSTGGQNGVVYKFFLDQHAQQNCLGEWHVHWGRQNRAESPGWKKGRDGDKEDSNLNNMRKLLGQAWGETKNGPREKVQI